MVLSFYIYEGRILLSSFYIEYSKSVPLFAKRNKKIKVVVNFDP